MKLKPWTQLGVLHQPLDAYILDGWMTHPSLLGAVPISVTALISDFLFIGSKRVLVTFLFL